VELGAFSHTGTVPPYVQVCMRFHSTSGVNGVALGHRYSIVRDVVNGKEHVTGNFGYLSNLGRVEGEGRRAGSRWELLSSNQSPMPVNVTVFRLVEKPTERTMITSSSSLRWKLTTDPFFAFFIFGKIVQIGCYIN